MYNYEVYDELFSGTLVVPWRCIGDDYSPEIISLFEWKTSYGKCKDEMLAHLDFWYDQVFSNLLLQF